MFATNNVETRKTLQTGNIFDWSALSTGSVMSLDTQLLCVSLEIFRVVDVKHGGYYVFAL